MEAIQNMMEKMFTGMQKMFEYCLEKPLKTMNSIIASLGISMVLCSLWMIRIWDRDIHDGSLSFPGYIHYFLGLGIIICVISWFGQVALKKVNTNIRCFVFYEAVCFLVIVVNYGFGLLYWCPNTKEAYPDDPSGKFDNLKNFAEPILTINVILAFFIMVAQFMSLIIAVAEDKVFDEDDVFALLSKV